MSIGKAFPVGFKPFQSKSWTENVSSIMVNNVQLTDQHNSPEINPIELIGDRFLEASVSIETDLIAGL